MNRLRRHDGKIIAWELALRGKPRFFFGVAMFDFCIIGRGWTGYDGTVTRRRFNVLLGWSKKWRVL